MCDNIVGTHIGIFEVLYECDYKANDGHKLYHVKCSECGWESDMMKAQIKVPKKCTHKNLNGGYRKYRTFTWSNKRIAGIFRDMKSRCYNENDKSYRWYGAKGIIVCDEWINNPILFEEWALNNGYEDNLTIDRIDSNKNYSPENCRWISQSDNCKYKSTSSLINVDGEEHTGREWAKVLGIGTNRINTYKRTYGEEQTIEFIRQIMNSTNKVCGNF